MTWGMCHDLSRCPGEECPHDTACNVSHDTTQGGLLGALNWLQHKFDVLGFSWSEPNKSQQTKEAKYTCHSCVGEDICFCMYLYPFHILSALKVVESSLLSSLVLRLTLTQNIREMGSVARQSSTETRASNKAMQPGPSASPGVRLS